MASDKHIELQNMVAKWIGNRTIKMCALPECNAVGYIADFVAIARMNDADNEKYCRHCGLEAMYMSHVWQGEGEPLKDIVKGDIDRHYVCVFEVKVSRSDFLNTFGGKESPHSKARMEPVGTAHWVVANKGICKPEELPDFWGLLEPYGTGLTEKKMPKLNILPENIIHSIAFDMLWLNMNYRISYFDQIRNMADAVGIVHQAIIRDKPKQELLRRSNEAVKACAGLVG